MFDTGRPFPPPNEIERLATARRGEKTFRGKLAEISERASKVLKDSPHAAKLRDLQIAVNVADILITKPADLLVGEPPTYESGESDDSIVQQRLLSIVEENDFNQRIREAVVGAGYRGDAWWKVSYAFRQDVSEVEALGLTPPELSPEPIIEAVDSSCVFPEVARGSRKRFKAINIATVEHVTDATGKNEKSYLNVERHLPGYIVYERYELHDSMVASESEVYEEPILTYTIGERVATGRENDVEATGVPRILVHHIPYKTDDDDWRGTNGLEKIESLLAAINDRIVLVDYVITKHSDPPMYGPPLDAQGGTFNPAGMYVEMEKTDATPGYMTWDGQLEAAFKELHMLLGLVYQLSETPQWVFGTTVAGDTAGGTGTSHTDSGAILARFFPLTSKVKRLREYVDIAARDILYTAMLLENAANEGVEGWVAYDPPYPKIRWKDGIPRNAKEEAEIMAQRTGGKPTIDQRTAVKLLDNLDDKQSQEILDRIDDDEERMNGTVESSIFNATGATNDEGVA